MSKEQENLRQKFIDETKAELWAEDINEDVGFSDKYVEWLEQQLLIPLVVDSEAELCVVNKRSKLLICKNNEQHTVHYYKDTKQKVCMVCGEQ